MPQTFVAQIRAVSHYYGKTAALDEVTLEIPAGCMAGLIGPDGVGKSTLLALIAGVRRIQSGTVNALGGDMKDKIHRKTCHHRIAYMPQGLGKNLYPTLSVFENLDFFGRLFGQPEALRRQRISELLKATALDSFAARPAGKLSGGMKQKLSLCSALIHDPDLLILDEPTTGVDPLSRQQFWDLIDTIRSRRPGMSVIVATAYMEEADRFDWLAAMDDGKLIASGAPAKIKSQTSKDSLEEAFIALLPDAKRHDHKSVVVTPRVATDGPPAIEAQGLTCRFGDFVAVDQVSFRIERGEIFGFLGSNGCGKSTTMKMLTGLLPATEGSARLFGSEFDAGDLEIRRRVGYMSQAFSLYGELTVLQNLVLHAQLFQIPPEDRKFRVSEMLKTFDLAGVAGERPEGLPLGIRQRLQLAVALIHKPEILILDEPTSGVDPIARDQFWQHLIDLSRNQSVTIFISTHFMNEAERCDRISLMHAGKVLAVGTPQELVKKRGKSELEDAFVSYLKEAAGINVGVEEPISSHVNVDAQSNQTAMKNMTNSFFDPRRLWAYARRETLEILRDPLRLAFAILGPMLLMFAFGYGISFDVEDLSYAVLDNDRTAESRELLESFSGSRFFVEQSSETDIDRLHQRLKNGELTLAIEIPAGFGKDLISGDRPEVGIWLDGALPFRAQTVQGYVSGLGAAYLSDQYLRKTGTVTSLLPIGIETRFAYNQSFKSVNAMIPGIIMLMLVLIPAMMTAVGVVREKETGSIANFRSTPVTRFEFLVGKQLPYIGIALVSYLTLLMLSLFVFGVQVKGSHFALIVGVVLYVLATTGFGLLMSSFTRTQVAAIFGTAIITIIPAINFSGFMVPVSSLTGAGWWVGHGFPASWFQQISVGTLTKSLGFNELWVNHVVLILFAVAFISAAQIALRKQEA